MNMTCPAAQVITSIIPIVGIVFAAIVIFFALLWKHNEIKMRISKNTYTPMNFDWKIFSLLSGLCLVGVGIVLSLVFFLVSGFSYELLGGLIPLSLGIMLLIFNKLVSK